MKDGLDSKQKLVDEYIPHVLWALWFLQPYRTSKDQQFSYIYLVETLSFHLKNNRQSDEIQQ